MIAVKIASDDARGGADGGRTRPGRGFDLTGQTFKHLTAERPVGRDRSGSVLWACRCVCGELVTYPAGALRFGTAAASCGCRHGRRIYAPGVRETSEYTTWRGMRQRTRDPGHKAFGHYGGRGIRVCERWQTFGNFLEDMGPKPAPDYMLDRLDPDGDYEPGNCRWASPLEQGRNRRNTIWLTHGGRRLSVTAWAEETGIRPGTLRGRVKRGLPAEAVLAPVRRTAKAPPLRRSPGGV